MGFDDGPEPRGNRGHRLCEWLSLTGSGGNSASENRGGGTHPVVAYAIVVTPCGELASGRAVSSSLL